MKFNAEILAPAGNFDSIIAAVRSGADAVYLGLHSFSARKNAGNFSEKELKEACQFARVRDVKVYLALNTLIKDKELPMAIEAVKTAALCGVDAVIVQDLGLFKLLREMVPQMPIHASTQMSVSTPEAVFMLHKMGAKRVVLARELSFSEIKNIKSKTDCELEVFVHGALCMCVSGQCLFSSVLGARSGNRGLCAQPCRLPFLSSVDKNSHSLSLKDLSLIKNIKELDSLGVASLKIEGRMKRPEYVSCAVKSISDSLSGNEYDLGLLKDVFSRSGFTDGYFKGVLDKDMFGKREKEDVVSAPEAFSKIHEFYKKERSRIGVSFFLKAQKGEPLYLEIADERGNKAHAFGDIVCNAKNAPCDKSFFEDKLSKLGNTPYYLKALKCEIESGVFASASMINSLKNELCESLTAKRAEAPRVELLPFSYAENPFIAEKQRLYVRLSRLSDLPESFEEKVDKILVPIDDVLISPLREGLKEKIVLTIPSMLFSPEKIEALKEKLLKAKALGFSFAAADTLNSLAVLKELDFSIIGLPGLNALNSLSFSCLKEMGVEECALSLEASARDTGSISSPIPMGIVAFKHIPLMTCRTCPVTHNRDCKNCKYKGGYLLDRLNKKFPVRCSQEYSEVLNSCPLYVGEKLSEFKNISFFLLDLRSEKEKGYIMESFLERKALDREITRGLYFKELL